MDQKTKEQHELFAGFCFFLTSGSMIDGAIKDMGMYFNTDSEKPFQMLSYMSQIEFLYPKAADALIRNLFLNTFIELDITSDYIKRFNPKKWESTFKNHEEFQTYYAKLAPILESPGYTFEEKNIPALYKTCLEVIKRDNIVSI